MQNKLIGIPNPLVPQPAVSWANEKSLTKKLSTNMWEAIGKSPGMVKYPAASNNRAQESPGEGSYWNL